MDTNAHDLTAAYALDALDSSEVAVYEEHLAHCPRCREELAELSETATALAYAVPAPVPSLALRARIIDAAVAERPSNVVPLRPRWALPAVAAAAVAAAAAIVFAVSTLTLSHSLHRERSASETQRGALGVIAQPDARRIALSGDHGSLVLAKSGQAALVINRLEPAPKGKTYEAWVVEAGKPQRAGLLHGGGDIGVLELTRSVPDGALVMVTLERAGGVDTPTGSSIFRARAL